MSSEKAETCELNRMKHNAFKVCEEVLQRVDEGVASGGYIKARVTPDEDRLFFWDQKYQHYYLAIRRFYSRWKLLQESGKFHEKSLYNGWKVQWVS